MALDILKEKGVPLDRQRFTWRELAGPPFSKLDDDAFTRVRVIVMNGIESESVRFSHAAARMNDGTLREPLARVRRVEHHQQTLVNWMNPPDQSPLETTLGYEQAAVELTCHVASAEPDPYLAQVYRFGLLEDFDHLYRYSALMDRVEGRDPNNLTQSYTDIRPGRPTAVEHRDPADDLRRSYDRARASPLTKLNAGTIVAAENQVHDYYLTVGPLFSDPVARALYAEIASIEEQHVTQYECICDPRESWLEKWLLHEATEVWNYWSCLQTESNSRCKEIWERFLSYELGHLQVAMDCFRRIEGRDPAEVLPSSLPDPIAYESHRAFMKQALQEIDLRANGADFVTAEQEPERSRQYRAQLNAKGSPSEIIAEGYRWRPGTELIDRRPMVSTGYEGRLQ
jgi:hypothetical protein